MTTKAIQILPSKLAEVWDKAEAIVANDFDHGDGSYQARKAAIASNMLSLSKAPALKLKDHWHTLGKKAQEQLLEKAAGLDVHVRDADKEIETIWDKMTPQQKADYLAWHPRSKFHAVHRRESSFTMRDNPNDARDPVHAEGRKKAKRKRAPESEQPSNDDEPERRPEPESNHTQPEAEQEQQPADGQPQQRQRRRRRASSGNGAWWDRLSIEQQAEYLRKHPNSKKAKRHKGIVRNLVASAMHKVHGHVKKLGHDYRNGMAGLRNFREGRKMTDEQKTGLKKTAKVVGGLVLGALVGVAMFTPLAGYAMELGSMYLDHVFEGKSESGVNLDMHAKKSTQKADKQDEDDLSHMTMDMTNWLLKQDPVELAQKLKKRSEK